MMTTSLTLSSLDLLPSLHFSRKGSPALSHPSPRKPPGTLIGLQHPQRLAKAFCIQQSISQSAKSGGQTEMSSASLFLLQMHPCPWLSELLSFSWRPCVGSSNQGGLLGGRVFDAWSLGEKVEEKKEVRVA